MKKKVKPGNKITPLGNPEGKLVAPLKGTTASAKQIKDTPFENFIKKNALLIFTVTSLLLVFIVFHRFLLLKETYLFKDIGSDTIAGFWPTFTHISEYIRNTGFPKWSFNWGVGKNIYPLNIGNPFTLALYLLPKDCIPYAIIFAEVLKIFLAGLFFLLFLRLLKLTAYTSIIGGLLYSFSSFMIIGSGWYMFSTEALYAAIVLYCCEKFLREGAWYLVPIPFFLIAAFNPFMLYLYGLLVFIYCIAKIIANDGWQEGVSISKRLKNLLFKITLTLLKIGALAFFGVIISSFIFLSDMDMLIHTSRGFGGEASSFKELVSTSIFSLSTSIEITTSLYRFFSSDLLGTGNNFNGLGNYLEAPMLYTGLITCILMPQAFFIPPNPQEGAKGADKRVIYLVLTILAIIPLVFPFFRNLFWLFSGDYYRTYSLFVSMLFLMLCLKSLSAIDSKFRINTFVLFITLAVLLVLLYYPYFSSSKIIVPATGTLLSNAVNNSLRKVVAFFLVFYTCLIYVFNIPKIRNQNFVSLPLILGIIILTELAYFSYITVNNRPVISSAELHQKVGYNDYTLDALQYINARDTGFFRISKNYCSSPSSVEGGYNDGLMQNYKTTSDYDSFNQPNYIHFLNEMNVWSNEDINRKWIAPSSTRPVLAVILNEKYILLKQPLPYVPSFYDSITTTGNVTVAKYKIYLPFGYTYQNYISLSEFRKLNNFQKDKMLFQAFVADTTVETRHALSLPGLHQLYAKDTIPGTSLNLIEFGKYAAALRQDSLSNVVYTQNTVKGTVKFSQTKLLFLTIPYDKGWALKVDGTIVKPLMSNIGFTGVVLEKGEHTIEMNYEPPFLILGTYISGVGLLGYLFLFIRYRKKRF